VLAVVVVIDVVPADASPEQKQVMVEACSSGVTQGTCALATTTPESTRPGAVALVFWRGTAFLEATVRVGQGNGQWVSRQLTFADADPDRDRWVTVGLTVASLLDEARSAAPSPTALPAANPIAPSPLPVSPSPVVKQTKPEPPRAKARPPGAQLAISAGVLLGTGWDAGAAMAGGWATVALSVFDRHFVGFAGGSLAFSSGPSLPASESATSRWLAMEAGFGPQVNVAPFRFFAAPVLALQAVSADLGSRGPRADREWELKLRAGAVWEVTRHWGLSFGGAARLLPIESASTDPTRARRSGLVGELLAGAELRL
jgi:hypothetical protein